jgi:hypothetical protein
MVCFKIQAFELRSGSKLLTDGNLDDTHPLHANVQVNPPASQQGCPDNQIVVVELWAAVPGRRPSMTTCVKLASRHDVSQHKNMSTNPRVPESGSFRLADHASILNPDKAFTYGIDIIARAYVKDTKFAVYPTATDSLSAQDMESFNCRTAFVTVATKPIDRIPQPKVPLEQAVREAQRTIHRFKK